MLHAGRHAPFVQADESLKTKAGTSRPERNVSRSGKEGAPCATRTAHRGKQRYLVMGNVPSGEWGNSPVGFPAKVSYHGSRAALNHGLHPTALRARKSAASRAFSELSSEVAHAALARRVMRNRLGGH